MTARGDRSRAVFTVARKTLEDSRAAMAQADATGETSARWWGRLEVQLAWLLEVVDPQPPQNSKEEEGGSS